MSMVKVGDKLATRNGFAEYEVERVHDDGTLTVVEDLRFFREIARRYRVDPDDLVPNQNQRIAINCNRPLVAA